MSTEELVLFLQNAVTDARLRARFQRRVSYGDFQAIAKDRGFDLDDLSAGEAKSAIRVAADRLSKASLDPLPSEFYDRWPDGK